MQRLALDMCVTLVKACVPPLQIGRTLQSTLVEGNKQKCGYAAVADVATGDLSCPVLCYSLHACAV